MTDAATDLEQRIDELNARLSRVEDLVAALQQGAERSHPGPAAPMASVQRHAAALPPTLSETTGPSLIPIVGRSLLAMGGAYLLRALTDSHVVHQTAGVALGLAYVVVWMIMASRQAAAGRTAAATASALIAAIIAYPLIWEATDRFHIFSIEAASLLLLIVSFAQMYVAWRHALSSAAWIVSFASLGCAVALMLASEQVAVPLIAFAIVGAALWHVAAERSWSIVAWLPAAAVTVMCVAQQLLVVAGRGADAPAAAAVALLIVAASYAGAVSAKTLLRQQDLTAADAVISAALIVIALTGTARIAATVHQLDGASAIGIGALSIGSYLLALTQPLSPKTARYFAAIAVPCMMIATAIPSTPTVAAFVWLAAAAGSIAIAETMSNPDFRLHAVVYTLAAAFASGTLRAALWSISGIGAPATLTASRAAVVAIIVVLAVAAVLLNRTPAGALRRTSTIVLFSLATLVVIAAIVQILLHTTTVDRASAAAVRSVVIALAAVALSVLSRMRKFPDASLLVYPVLGVGAAKFLVDDFMSGRAITLFVTLAVYGFTLLLLPRLRKTATV